MKKLVLGLFLLTLLGTRSQAQVAFGIKAGANLSNLAGKGLDDRRAKLGGYGAIFSVISLTEKMAIQPELSYSMEGAKASYDHAVRFNLNYINIPLMFQYSEAARFYLELGPQLGILTSAKVKFTNFSEDLKDGLKSTNLSAVFGLGYQFTPAVGLSSRGAIGLSNISKDTGGDEKVKATAFSIGMHYTFGK